MLNEFDHRAIGARLDLFHVQEEAPGMIFWHPRGFTLYRLVEAYLRDCLAAHGYQEIRTPQVLSRSLWEESGHWHNFREGMLTVDDGEHDFALKPVNCPGHVQVFRRGIRSYRDLPLRLAEFGACHRNEQRGALHGLMRVRGFVQDDAHIFCREDQVPDEIAAFVALLRGVYLAFGFPDVDVAFSSRPPERAGDDATWDRAEAALLGAAHAVGLDPVHQPGQGAFYGPKLEFALRDAHGRAWQCGTIQLDLVLPERLDAHYIDREGARARPVMLHRAIVGSLERFVGILLEHARGALPPWLSPSQVVVAPIAEAHQPYGASALAALRQRGLRATLDGRPESLARRIVDAREAGAPFLWVVGAREAEAGTVSVRDRAGASQLLPLQVALDAAERACARPPIPLPSEDRPPV
ncbi:threonine--tRNA ligase [Chondromyces apiculatus]|uniref:Threonine--tRNA ligase n=1 Tax=Chondromyces apiculatus DSM 436 TaxID=1192034 RepID=A0A017T749_9BACT|nr:threonine--tRNA ligase [Chondromyces apiculatus]EYF04620.1 Threonyl-tRNA synthetase [Chondromyces apiculatus DSM 436]